MSEAARLLEEEYLVPLKPWLHNKRVTDICCQRQGEFWICQDGVWKCEEIPVYIDRLRAIALLGAAIEEKDVNTRNPICDTELPGGKRLNIIMPNVVPSGEISIAIRNPDDEIFPMESILTRYQTAGWNEWKEDRAGRDLSEAAARFREADLIGFLDAAVRARLNILMCGRTGASKTSLAKIVITAIPKSDRIVTIEDGTRELKLTQPNCVRLLYPKNRSSGIGSLELFQAALRMQPDRILVGELRDDAAWTYVEVVSGYSGSITTIHGHTPSEAMRRLALLFKSSESGKGFDTDMMMDILTASVDVIIPLNQSGGVYGMGSVWFVGDEKSGSAADLLKRG